MSEKKMLIYYWVSTNVSLNSKINTHFDFILMHSIGLNSISPAQVGDHSERLGA